ncbi:cob(I)yrinic acid a,c-diamide adenosyltransferase [Candidatus Electronema sp. JM]|uniref:cob(I)yrinic acid a,c-diamide adenosyltransferase n=1 Tax=Candidatus Electronema sp. JM TaxID=3401571 RepID=UPI003AA9BA0C
MRSPLLPQVPAALLSTLDREPENERLELPPEGRKGLLLLYTGNGKGKTTAALGLILRALGHGWRICFIQFIKGGWQSGELTALGRFSDLLDIHVVGRGFTWQSDDLTKDAAAARAGWELARQTLAEEKHRLVVLDELTYPIKYGMLAEEEVLAALARRNPAAHVVITGRGAGERLLHAADLVTELNEVKHPYRQGIKAQQGIEF